MNDVDLRDHIERILDERDRAHKALHDSAERQLNATADALHDKLASMNEFRNQITGERALYVQKEYLERILSEHEKLQAAQTMRTDERITALERWQSNMMGRLAVFGGLLILVMGIVSMAVRFVGR